MSGALASAASLLLPAVTTPADAEVPRDKTMVLISINAREGRWIDHELWNPYAVGSNHQNGINLIYEPLAYYSAFADRTYMWLAESFRYTEDFRQLTITTRSGIAWSDGTPFSAADVAYTFNTLRDLGPKSKWGVDIAHALAAATVIDTNTVVLDFNVPAPRFFFFCTYKFDIGVPIVPKHVFEGQDWTSFKHFDVSKGWPVTTGPWRVADASLQQKVFVRRASWWAAEQKLAPMPQVLKNVWLPFVAEQQSAQALITDQVDMGGTLQPPTFPTVMRQNPKISTFTGQQAPYGYIDWWPVSLYLNNEKRPFDDRDVRWAISHYIDRTQIVDVSFLGACSVSSLPLPPYPPLQPYFEAVKDLLAKYDTLAFDPPRGDALLQAKGFRKQGAAWHAPDGAPLTLEIVGFGGLGAAIGPVLSQLLKRYGVAATINLPPDFNERFQKGLYTGAIYGHGGSIREPYDTLRLYQGKSIAVPGAHLVNFSRWRNPDFDKIVDEAYITAPSNVSRLRDLFRAAMEIWLPELPGIQLVQNYHRIPLNTSRWTNWPKTDSAYVNPAPWHLTFPLVMWNLTST